MRTRARRELRSASNPSEGGRKSATRKGTTRSSTAAAAGATTWDSQVQADRRVLDEVREGIPIDGRAALAIARLLDTKWRDEADDALQRAKAASATHAGVAYASGFLAAASGATDEAVEWFTRAQSALEPTDRALGARIAFELGYIYAARAERHVAEVVLAWGRALDGGAGVDAADVIHLAALVETLMGNHARARALYHQAVERASDALTPRSRVLALSNLAVSLTHTDPLESAHLSGLALATHRSHLLHPRAEPPMRNILGYALICCGELRDASRVLQSAANDAQAAGHHQAALYARFNLAIVDEIRGQAERSGEELRAIADLSARAGLSELAGWCTIRLAWLELLRGNGAAARALLEGVSLREAQVPAAAVIHGLLARQAGRLRTAATALRRVIDDFKSRGDDLSTFACFLWLGIVEQEAGRTSAAIKAVHEALTIGQGHAFRLAANWWSADLVAVARSLAPPELRDYAAELVAPATPPVQPSSRSRVEASRDGSLCVDDSPLTAERWRIGRTGSKVLRRLFVALVAAYPSALRRDELTDFMWPESEGDRAVANLYAAANDLRAVLADVPGVALVSRDGAYALDFGPNVEIVDHL